MLTVLLWRGTHRPGLDRESDKCWGGVLAPGVALNTGPDHRADRQRVICNARHAPGRIS